MAFANWEFVKEQTKGEAESGAVKEGVWAEWLQPQERPRQINCCIPYSLKAEMKQGTVSLVCYPYFANSRHEPLIFTLVHISGCLRGTQNINEYIPPATCMACYREQEGDVFIWPAGASRLKLSNGGNDQVGNETEERENKAYALLCRHKT